MTRLYTYVLFCLLALSTVAWGTAQTYYWVGGIGTVAWADGSTWNTTKGGGGTFRTASAGDILIIDGTDLGSGATGALSITGVATQTISKLQITGSANVTFSASTATAGAGTIVRASAAVTGTGTSFTTDFAVGDFLFTSATTTQIATITSNTSLTTVESGTITAGTSYSKPAKITITGNQPGLDIGAGSSLTISSTNPVILSLPTLATGSVSGSMTFSGSGHRLINADASSLTFNNGATFTATSAGFNGNAFAASGTANAIIFASGSVYILDAGSNPFGLTAPASRVTFQSGSLLRYTLLAGTPSFSGRTYANFELNQTGTFTVTGGSAVSINDLTITQGTLNFNVTGTPGHSIKGNISVASGQTLSFAGAGTVNLNGTALQSISGSGAMSTTSVSTIAINNSNGISLGKNLLIGGTLAMTAGNVALNGNTLTLGTTIALPGSLTYTAGYLTGTGTFTRWFATAAISGNAGLFPMGVGANNRSLAIGGSPSTGGPIAVSYNNATTVSSITFTENVQNFVNRYDANWVVTPSGGYTDPAMTLTIHGDGIPGITNVADLDLSAAAVIATGVYASPSGTTSAPVLTRNGLTQGTIVTNPFYIASTVTSPLPVEMTSFTAAATGSSALLRWSTATEVNNMGFDVERKTAKSDWAKIGFVSGNGTSNAPHAYTYADNATAGTYSYRLKQIDRDGKFEYSSVVEVKIALTAADYTLQQNYPNPFNPATVVRFAVPTAQKATLKIYNSAGQEVATLFNGIADAGRMYELSFDGSQLASGVYFSILQSGGKQDVKKMTLLR